jgi:hypothetical protein
MSRFPRQTPNILYLAPNSKNKDLIILVPDPHGSFLIV